MKNYLKAGCTAGLLFVLLAGCSENTEKTKGAPQTKKVHSTETSKEKQKETNSKPVIEKGTPEWDLQQITKAVDDNDKSLFMSYQNEENTIFFKEQQRWIDEVEFKKKQGYTVSLNLHSFHPSDDTTATVSFSVMMSHPKLGSTTNTVTYQMIKSGDKWIFNDVPFEKMVTDSGNLTVYYPKGHETEAKQTFKDANDIVAFYSKKFNWNPEPISIKIYPSSNEASATVPWLSLGGWNEIGESLKITTELSANIFHFLAHELTHKMVGEMANDNATIYVQEGFATYLEGTVVRDASGQVTYDPKIATEKAAKAIAFSNSIKTIEELGTIDYTDPENSMYRDGFLLSNYLIETNGLPAFMNMLHYLSKFDYIDQRSEHKMDTCQERTLAAIENIYGPAGTVSADVKNFYTKGSGQ